MGHTPTLGMQQTGPQIDGYIPYKMKEGTQLLPPSRGFKITHKSKAAHTLAQPVAGNQMLKASQPVAL